MHDDDTATILVVEDDDATRTFLADNLTADGFELLVADCAHDGIRLLETKFPDLALIDVGLPDGAGSTSFAACATPTGSLRAYAACIDLQGWRSSYRIRGFERRGALERTMHACQPHDPSTRATSASRSSAIATQTTCAHLESQRRAITALAEREGFDVEWLNPQLNVSGAKADRAAIMDAVGRIERGELAGIAVYKLDRLSRRAAPADRALRAHRGRARRDPAW